MKKVPVKKIKTKALQIKNAWNEGARDVPRFRKTVKTEYEARIAEGQALDDEIDDLYARVSIKEDERDTVYLLIDKDNVDIRKGVVGHEDYGDDCPLYGAMGFVRESERDSGLTRGRRTTGEDEDDND